MHCFFVEHRKLYFLMILIADIWKSSWFFHSDCNTSWKATKWQLWTWQLHLFGIIFTQYVHISLIIFSPTSPTAGHRTLFCSSNPHSSMPISLRLDNIVGASYRQTTNISISVLPSHYLIAINFPKVKLQTIMSLSERTEFSFVTENCH